jgi:hypothetical protein
MGQALVGLLEPVQAQVLASVDLQELGLELLVEPRPPLVLQPL